ncbi:MAG: DUF4160 domain-containing protein [Bacteroidia bacterium]
MPKIAFYKNFWFFFYVYDLRERRHVHVEAQKGRFRNPAKIWFENGVEVAEPGNLSKKELRLLANIISKNIDVLNKQFDTYIRTGKVKPVKLDY